MSLEKKIFRLNFIENSSESKKLSISFLYQTSVFSSFVHAISNIVPLPGTPRPI